jgi:hypothetical protein
VAEIRLTTGRLALSDELVPLIEELLSTYGIDDWQTKTDVKPNDIRTTFTFPDDPE